MKTPDNAFLRFLFGEEISVKEAVVAAAAVVILLGVIT